VTLQVGGPRRGETERRDSGIKPGGSKMKPSIENEIAGKVHEVKGKIKEKAGELTNDPDLEGKGIGEKIAGKIQNKIGHAQKALGK
jgi:uncharacterized protein YjbJ (UPF0337 family)